MPYHTSRSAIKAGRTCRRLRYNQYHALGTGLVPGGKVSVDLSIGTAMHAAAEHLLKGGDPAGAVIAALESLDLEAQWVRSNGAQWECREETLRLIELMVHLFARVAMPELVEKYDVSEVEADSAHQLAIVGGEDVKLEIKPDAKLTSVATGEVGAFSLKTISKYAPWVAQRDQLELQNYTEPWAVNGTFVQMCYIAKGSKGKDAGVAYENPLLYPYWNEKNDHWSWAYRYIGDDHKPHNLGKEWKRVPIWEFMDISTWLNMIDTLHSPDAAWPWHRVKPYDRWVIMPLLVGRSLVQIERVMKTLMVEETQHFARLTELDDENNLAELEELFPREGTDCATPTHVCPYFTACLSDWTPAQMRQFGFVPRVPHHAQEQAAFEDNE